MKGYPHFVSTVVSLAMISNTVLQIYNPRDNPPPPGDEPSAKKYGGAWLRAKDHSHTNLNPQGNDHQSTTQNAQDIFRSSNQRPTPTFPSSPPTTVTNKTCSISLKNQLEIATFPPTHKHNVRPRRVGGGDFAFDSACRR